METPYQKKLTELQHKIMSTNSRGKKYKDLMKQMKAMTGMDYSVPIVQDSGTFDLNYGGTTPNFYPPLSHYDSFYTPKPTEYILFYGFTGMLAKRYSVLKVPREEAEARMSMTKLPWTIKEEEEFVPIVNSFQGTPNALEEIDYNEAMNIIRIGIQEVQVEDFEEAEVDEFDDNCVESCKPGDHHCSKC